MRNMSLRVILPLLCVLALTIGTVGTLLAQGAAQEPSSAPATQSANPTALAVSDILERDGYLEGIWFPWLTHDNLGHGFTANETMVEYVGNNWSTVGIDQYSDKYLLEQIYNLKALGFNIMGYEGSIYAEGVKLDLTTGEVLGIKEDYLKNVDKYAACVALSPAIRPDRLDESKFGTLRELFLENKENMLFELDTILENLTAYKTAIQQEDFTPLRQLLDDGRRIKEEVDGH
mgnify:CR=1 FL=1